MQAQPNEDNDQSAASEPTRSGGVTRPQAISGQRRQRSPSIADEPETRNGLNDGNWDRRTMRRVKRPRLEPSSKEIQPIKYGYYGQVEPGRLKLDIVSCDGGEHLDPRHPGTFLGPQNILRHDQSVYCSQRQHTNILLTHADNTPFCLEKVYIVAPEYGFTAPVREGLVYVSMTLHHLTPYIDPPAHAQRQGVHTPPYLRPTRSRATSDAGLTIAEALRDPEISSVFDRRQALATQGRSIADELASVRSLAGPQSRHEALARLCNVSSTAEQRHVTVSQDSNGRHITIVSDEEPGPEEVSPQDVLDFRESRHRRMRRHQESFRDENWTRYSAERDRDDRQTSNSGLARLDALMARSRVTDIDGDDVSVYQRFGHSRIPGPTHTHGQAEWGLHPAAMATSTRDRDFDADDTINAQSGSTHPPTVEDEASAAAKGVEEDLRDSNVTAVRFRMCREKFKVAIQFDPPVSGRFILLKLWAQQNNVDVQSVIAMGYGGCRFFPAIELR